MAGQTAWRKEARESLRKRGLFPVRVRLFQSRLVSTYGGVIPHVKNFTSLKARRKPLLGFFVNELRKRSEIIPVPFEEFLEGLPSGT